jgi:hypothetical protein
MRFVKIAISITLGLIMGYLAYLPALGMILFLRYGRIDRWLFVYGLLLPIQAPLLLNEDFRGNLQNEEMLLLIIGDMLLALGVILSLKFRRSGEGPRGALR